MRTDNPFHEGEIQFEVIDRLVKVPAAAEGQLLSHEQITLIEASNTFFVASAHAQPGVDASHQTGISLSSARTRMRSRRPVEWESTPMEWPTTPWIKSPPLTWQQEAR